MREVTLYGRDGCHLCDEARVALERVRRELPFRLVERDITDEEALHRAYFDRIPVIALDGRELCEYVLDEDLLRRELSLAAPNPS
jgi:glutathione S-transferase